MDLAQIILNILNNFKGMGRGWGGIMKLKEWIGNYRWEMQTLKKELKTRNPKT